MAVSHKFFCTCQISLQTSKCKLRCKELWVFTVVCFVSSPGSTRTSRQLLLQRNSKNYKSQILPHHKNYNIPLTVWKQKQRTRTKQVCINAGGGEINIRLTVAMVMVPALCTSWTTAWTFSHEVAALHTCWQTVSSTADYCFYWESSGLYYKVDCHGNLWYTASLLWSSFQSVLTVCLHTGPLTG